LSFADDVTFANDQTVKAMPTACIQNDSPTGSSGGDVWCQHSGGEWSKQANNVYNAESNK